MHQLIYIYILYIMHIARLYLYLDLHLLCLCEKSRFNQDWLYKRCFCIARINIYIYIHTHTYTYIFIIFYTLRGWIKKHEFVIKKKKRINHFEFKFRFARPSLCYDVSIVTVRITSLAACVGIRGQLPVVSAADCASPDGSRSRVEDYRGRNDRFLRIRRDSYRISSPAVSRRASRVSS